VKLPNFKPVTSFGLSKGSDRKVGIAAAALPKMRTPSGLAASQVKPPSIKVGAQMMSLPLTGRFEKGAAGRPERIAVVLRQLARGGARASKGAEGPRPARVAAILRRLASGPKQVKKASYGFTIAHKDKEDPRKTNAISVRRDDVRRGINAASGGAIGAALGYAATSRLPGSVRALVRPAATATAGALGAHVNLSSADRRWRKRMKGKIEGRMAKRASEHGSTFEQVSGESIDGSALGGALQRMARTDDPADSAEVARGQLEYRRFQGHDGQGALGRP
jgi:hypothetical protein